MSKYEVKAVVCDYGIYEDGELKLILNSRRIALQIKDLLEEDERKHRELNPIESYPPYLDLPKPKPEPQTNSDEVADVMARLVKLFDSALRSCCNEGEFSKEKLNEWMEQEAKGNAGTR